MLHLDIHQEPHTGWWAVSILEGRKEIFREVRPFEVDALRMALDKIADIHNERERRRRRKRS